MALGKDFRRHSVITIQPYTERHTEAVRRFNDRLKVGGLSTRFPLSPTPKWLPKIAGRRIFQECYLAVDGEEAVRGGYILKHQDFCIKNRVLSIADYHLPISEGAVNKSYPQIGAMLLRDAIGRQPLLYGLGIGSYDEPLARMLQTAGWSMFSVPFFFRVVQPTAFLRNIAFLRRSAAKRMALDLSAATGLGWLGIHAFQACRVPKEAKVPAAEVESVDEFSDWVDELWESHKDQYGMSAVRDAETLRILYPKNNDKFIRLKVGKRSRPIGWAVVLDSQLSGHKHFGDMRLGSIVDCFASVADAAAVVGAARQYLESRGVDLIVSNQSHIAWQRGFQQAGFLGGPSNFIFAASRELTGLLRREGVENDGLHFNRGDGDGPINL